jgi:hypothetical protein
MVRMTEAYLPLNLVIGSLLRDWRRSKNNDRRETRRPA